MALNGGKSSKNIKTTTELICDAHLFSFPLLMRSDLALKFNFQFRMFMLWLILRLCPHKPLKELSSTKYVAIVL